MWTKIVNDGKVQIVIGKVIDKVLNTEIIGNYALANGYAGLTVLCAYANSIKPDQNLELLAHKYLERSTKLIEASKMGQPAGLFDGISGLSFSAFYNSGDLAHYKHLISALDRMILMRADQLAHRISELDLLSRQDFDVISGACGIGAYLLSRNDNTELASALQKLLETLISKINSGATAFTTPNSFLFEHEKSRFQNGLIDLGVAHGLAGPLSLLSLASINDIEAPNIEEAIKYLADWFISKTIYDEYGINWPTSIPAETAKLRGKQSGAKLLPSRAAWCYGSPGISRALFLAGKATTNKNYLKTAISAMETVYKRPLASTKLNSPTFCHGMAGILQISLRFFNDTKLSVFKDKSIEIATNIANLFREDNIYGFKNTVGVDKSENNFALLEGATGIALALLAVTSDVEPTWDRLFLLS